MWAWIMSVISILSALWSNPLTQNIVKAATAVYAELPDGMVARTYDLVTSTATSGMGGQNKMTYVLATLQAEYPGIDKSIVRSLIENTLIVIKRDAL